MTNEGVGGRGMERTGMETGAGTVLENGERMGVRMGYISRGDHLHTSFHSL